MLCFINQIVKQRLGDQYEPDQGLIFTHITHFMPRNCNPHKNKNVMYIDSENWIRIVLVSLNSLNRMPRRVLLTWWVILINGNCVLHRLDNAIFGQDIFGAA